jgi:hypothetical protein
MYLAQFPPGEAHTLDVWQAKVEEHLGRSVSTHYLKMALQSTDRPIKNLRGNKQRLRGQANADRMMDLARVVRRLVRVLQEELALEVPDDITHEVARLCNSLPRSARQQQEEGNDGN